MIEKPINIALEAYVLSQKQLTGIGKAVLNYVRELQQLDTINNYFLYVNDELRHIALTNKNWHVFRRTQSPNRLKISISSKIKSMENDKKKPRTLFVTLKIAPMRLLKALLESADRIFYFFRMEYSFKKNNITVYLGTSPHFLPAFYFSNPRKVGFIWDLVWILYPETMEYWNLLRMRFTLKRNIKKMDFLISISENTKKDYQEILRIKKPITTIPLAADPELFYQADAVSIKSILQKYGIKKKYILTVCTLEPRKNLGNLIKAYELIKNSKNFQIVLVGMKGWIKSHFFDSLKEAGLSDNIVITGYVPDEDLAPLYTGAEVFVFPSIYEGFGLPVLEAMQCGCPVITSNTSSLPEVVGDVGIMVNPYDIDGLSHTIEQVLKNRKLCETLSRKGLRHAKSFSWKKSTLKLLDEIIGK